MSASTVLSLVVGVALAATLRVPMSGRDAYVESAGIVAIVTAGLVVLTFRSVLGDVVPNDDATPADPAAVEARMTEHPRWVRAGFLLLGGLGGFVCAAALVSLFTY